MDPISLLRGAAQALWAVISAYQGNQTSLQQLAFLVDTAQIVAEAAAAKNPSEALAIIQNLASYVDQGRELVERMQRMGVRDRTFRIPALQRDLACVSSGIRDCLTSLSAEIFHLSLDNLERLTDVQSSLAAWYDEQREALEDLQMGQVLQTTCMHAQHEFVREALIAIMSGLNIGPAGLHERVQRYSQRRERAPTTTSSEQHVGMHACTLPSLLTMLTMYQSAASVPRCILVQARTEQCARN